MLVFPWVLRNHFEFGYPVISRGGGDVLLIRTEFNQMNDLKFEMVFMLIRQISTGSTLVRFSRIKVTLSVEAHWMFTIAS